MNIKDLLIQWNQRKWEEKNRVMYSDGREDNQWPWYNDGLDPDVLEYLQAHKLTGGHVLDLGTCSGSQAIALARLGYNVVGSDISDTALAKARRSAEEYPQLSVSFINDDITKTKLPSASFDVILDRGCFHSICCFAGVEYAKNVLQILKPGGVVLLKTMSAKELRFVEYNTIGNQKIPMPYHFEEPQLRSSLEDFFEIKSIADSYFFSAVVDPPAQAYLTVLTHKQ